MPMRYAFWLLTLLLFYMTGCATTYSASTQLPPEEQGLYRVYSRVMTASQLRSYLARPTAADRAAYARQVGAAQQLEALSAEDRAAVLGGYTFVGMSRQALLLLWGEPFRRQGPPAYERWFYYGDPLVLATVGSSYQNISTITEVAIEDGKVVWWRERIPMDRNQSSLLRRLWNPFDD
jgi:hypothetical protein